MYHNIYQNDLMNTFNFIAFDLGATNGRAMLGTLTDGILELKELTRFPNKIIRIHDKYYWDIFTLYEAIKDGLNSASAQNIRIDAIGIDTWGVDFVYIGDDGSILSIPRSYRDPYTEGIPEEYFKIISKKELYQLTGIQIMNFNSLFQLSAAKKENSSALKASDQILFLPDALAYILTGNKVCEYTIASTSQLLNPVTKKFEGELLKAIGISSSIMPPIVMPGKIIGLLRESVAKECNISSIPVIAVAGHDTASAIISTPAKNKHFAYISSGTWSLMGIEVKEPLINDMSYKMNFTNEGGVDGTIRFLKNIAGMWLLEQCRKEWEDAGRFYNYAEIVSLSNSTERFQFFVDPDDPSFANPASMTNAIRNFCNNTGQKAPESDAEFIRCIFDSLVFKYKYTFNCLKEMAPFKIETLHIIGGGSQNKILNQYTANAIGLPVIAGPCEATAIGNIMMQAKGLGLVKSLKEIREIIRNSFESEIFYPEDVQLWEDAYKHFLKTLKIKS